LTSRTTWLASLCVLLGVAACGGEAQGSPGASSLGTSTPVTTSVPASGAASDPSLAPTSTPEATPTVAAGFGYGDILKVAVDRLAARVAPDRNAALVHSYDLTGPAPKDNGDVRLGKGDYVSVELGPVPVGTTTWYLVLPATATTLHPDGPGWYTKPPPGGDSGPAWVAASVGTATYMTLQRRPDPSEIQSFGDPGLTMAATGNFVSGPQPRHDAFAFEWAASAPTSGTACAFKLQLVPSDPKVKHVVTASVTTTSVKTSGRESLQQGTSWLPIPDGSWTTFTINVTSTCHWAVHYWRLEHD
jgi:hypothetical protein